MSNRQGIEFMIPGSIAGHDDLEQRLIQYHDGVIGFFNETLQEGIPLADEVFPVEHDEMMDDVWLITQGALQTPEPDEEALNSAYNSIMLGVLLTRQLVPPHHWAFDIGMVATMPPQTLYEYVWDKTERYRYRRPVLYKMVDRYRPHMNPRHNRADLVQSMAIMVCMTVDADLLDRFQHGEL